MDFWTLENPEETMWLNPIVSENVCKIHLPISKMRSEKSVKTVNTLKDKPSHFKEELEIVTRLFVTITIIVASVAWNRVASGQGGEMESWADKEGGYRVAG